MKRIITLFSAVLLISSFIHAQRISSFTIDGVPALGPSAAFNPTNMDESKPGTLEIVYPNSVDLSNVTAVYNCGNDAAMVTNPAPTDFTKNQTVRVEKNDGSSWAMYDIVCKQIKPASLPFDLINDGDFESGWDNTTVGWAGARLDKNQSFPRFGGANSNLLIAFDVTPGTLMFWINAAGEELEADAIFDVEESADGVIWSTIVRFDANNAMPGSKTTPNERKQEFTLNESSRFVRFLFTKRTKINVSITDLMITDAESSSIAEKEEAGVSAYILPGTKQLAFNNPAAVAKIEVINLSGISVVKDSQSAASMNLAQLPSGVYIVNVTNNKGIVSTNKIVIR